MAHARRAQVTGWAGWVVAVALLIGFAGLVHIVYGLAAIAGQAWYLSSIGPVYLFDTAQWGWAMLIGGIVMIASAALLYTGSMLGRVLGVILVAGSLLANGSLFLATPVWSTIAIAIDGLIIYAIIAHGDEMRRLDEEWRI